MRNERNNPIFQTYLKQLVHGCQASYCTCERCRSSKCFINHDLKANDETNEIAIKVATELSVSTRDLCQNMAPILYKPELYKYVEKFQEFAQLLITNQSINEHLSSVENIFDNFESFAFLFYENPPKDLTCENFFLNDELLSDFYDATFRRRNELKPLYHKFESMVNKLTSFKNYTALFHLRRIILTLMFGSFTVYPFFKSIFLVLIKHIIGLDKQSIDNIILNLSKLPKFLKRILVAAETNLSLFSLNPKLMISISSNVDLMLILNYIKLLFNSSELMANPLSISCFSNEAFSNLLNPNTEFLSFIRGQDNFLSFKMILTLSFKDKIRECECYLIQMQSAEEQNSSYSSKDNFHLNVRRQHIVEDTVRQLSIKTKDIKKHLYVSFEGESGIDYGGPSNEFFYLATSAIFSPNYGMFELFRNSFYWFSINPLEFRYYKTLGTLVGIAIYNSIILPIRFPIILYKKLLGKAKYTLDELSELKPEVAENLKKLREMNDVSVADITFSIDYQQFGKTISVDLIENGSNVIVNNQNVNQYIKLFVEWTLDKSIKKQYDLFEEGFMLVCKTSSLDLLYPEELDILVSGSTVVCWDELRRSTIYTDGYDKQSPTILMFWEVFNEFNDDEKSKFLLFTCGTNRVPINGLKELNFTIQRTTLVEKLPIAHTCSKTLSLPDYKNIDVLRNNLHLCIYCSEGFDLA